MDRAYRWGATLYLLMATTLLLAGDKKPAVFVADRDSAQITSSGDTTQVSGLSTDARHPSPAALRDPA